MQIYCCTTTATIHSRHYPIIIFLTKSRFFSIGQEAPTLKTYLDESVSTSTSGQFWLTVHAVPTKI